MLALLSALVAGCEDGAGKPSGGSTSLNPGPVPTTTTTPSRSTPSLTPLPKVFDETAVQDSVFKVLVDSYQVQNLDTVICPPDQPVRTGHQFQCSAKIDGERKSVPITVTSDTGAYDVGMPK